MSNKRDTFCILPWIGLEVRPDGKIAACCVNKSPLMKSEKCAFTFQDDGLDAAFQSADLAALRKNLSTGTQDKNCERCWSNEASSGQSRRLRFNRLFPDLVQQVRLEGIEPEQPYVLDLKLGNTCNLKCRICGPISSSLWAREFLSVHGDKNSLDTKVNFEVDGNDLYTWLPRVRRIEMSGGEPLLNKKYADVMKRSIELGVAKNQELQIITNGTVYPEDWMSKYFAHFGRVDIFLSIDGIGAQFEYQRYPARWGTVLNNFRRFKQTPYFRQIVFTVSLLNIYDVPECFRFWQELEESVVPNILLTPDYLSIRALHPDLRSKVCERLYGYEGLNSYYTHWLHSMVRSIARDDQSNLWSEFVRIVKKHDSYRNQQFSAVFPEFFQLCAEYW